jgi:hypothetical protein
MCIFKPKIHLPILEMPFHEHGALFPTLEMPLHEHGALLPILEMRVHEHGVLFPVPDCLHIYINVTYTQNSFE